MWPRPKAQEPIAADAFDRRIVTLLAFGPGVAMIVLAAVSGRGTFAMWGYPLWLFVGLWIVMTVRSLLDAERLTRVIAAWGAVFAVFVIIFIANYSVLPHFDHRYRAVFYPGDKVGVELTKAFRAATGQKLRYVIGSMWDGGNLAHYSPDQPQVLIDGQPARAPWIDLGDLHSKGAVIVWTEGDRTVIPIGLRALAVDAQVQPPEQFPYRRGDGCAPGRLGHHAAAAGICRRAVRPSRDATGPRHHGTLAIESSNLSLPFSCDLAVLGPVGHGTPPRQHNQIGQVETRDAIMKAILGIAALAGVLITTPASAEAVSFYMPSCKDFINGKSENMFLQGVCVGLLEGIATFASKLPAESSRSCPPDNVNAADLTKAVVKWFDEHQDRWNEDFRSLSLEALRASWPCK